MRLSKELLLEKMEEFIKERVLMEDLADSTRDRYYCDLPPAIDYLAEEGREISERWIKNYIHNLRREYAVSTTNNKIIHMIAFFRFLNYQGLLKEDEYSNIKTIRDNNKKKQKPYWKKQDLSKLIKHIGHWSNLRNRLRDLAIVKLFATTGIRLSELIGIDVDDLDFENKTALITRYKTHTTDEVYLTDEVIESISMYMHRERKEPEEGNALFVSEQGNRINKRTVQRLFKEYAKEITKNTDLHGVHSLRHTYANLFLRGGGDIKSLQESMGHSNMSTTSMYLRGDEDTKRRMANCIL